MAQLQPEPTKTSFASYDISLPADLPALIHDTWMYIRRVAKPFFSKRARWTYGGAIATGAFALVGIAAYMGVTTLQKYNQTLSNPTALMNEKTTGTTILDRNGVVLYQGYGAVDRHAIPFDEMPASIKQATIAAEDQDFYKHDGFSAKGTARAAYQDLVQHGTVEGGSTITQQLTKNTLLSDQKSFTRKYKEIVLSMDLERRYPKDQILQMYLNTIYYGEGAYGIEAASETYYHKPAKDLTLNESATLAGLPQSPSRFDPNINLVAATDRRDYVLGRMQTLGYADPTTVAATKNEPITAGTRDVVLKAPHFVFYVLDQLRKDYGEDKIEKGGLVVHTTLDYDKQVKAQEIVKNQIDKLASHHTTNGGLVSIDPHNGDIINMVGSADYNNPQFGAVNVTLAQLQPGSSFKPIAYTTAFTKGWNGATIVQDKPLSVPDGAGGTYAPQNYDLKFRGPVTLRRALANSLNIPAVEVLQYANIHDTISMAHNLGIQDPSLDDESRYGLSLVLGGGEVRPIDMARVYASFANEGTTVTPRAIISVQDKFSKDITKKTETTTKKAIDPRISYMITNILSDNNARKEEFGANSPLKLSRPAAAKTGTTNDFRDNWTVGYTPDLVTAVWVGNNDHTPMTNVDGITGAAPIWHDYMEMALADKPAKDFTVPAGVVFAKVCQADGGLASAGDTSAVNEVFLAGQTPTKPCGGQKKEEAKPAATPTPIEAQGPTSPTAPGVGGGTGDGKTEETPTNPTTPTPPATPGH